GEDASLKVVGHAEETALHAFVQRHAREIDLREIERRVPDRVCRLCQPTLLGRTVEVVVVLRDRPLDGLAEEGDVSGARRQTQPRAQREVPTDELDLSRLKRRVAKPSEGRFGIDEEVA